jgi:DNA-binding transcriptional regulator YiaG
VKTLGKSGRIKNFKKLRRLYNKSRGQMSAIIGVPLSEIKAWERNEKPCPVYIIELVKFKIDSEIDEGEL